MTEMNQYERIRTGTDLASIDTTGIHPGEEFDALVSAIIFDKPMIRHEKVCINGGWSNVYTWLPAGDDPANPPAGSALGARPPQYSLDFNLAWEALLRVLALGHPWQQLRSFEGADMRVCFDSNGAPMHCASIGKYNGGGEMIEEFTAGGDTMIIAILRVAMAAKLNKKAS